MQYFKNWLLWLAALLFWAIILILIKLSSSFFKPAKTSDIIYDVTEGGLKNQLHIGPVLTDFEKGKELFARCALCHSLQYGQVRVGPSLHNIIGRPIATEAGFPYSQALYNYAKAQKTWSVEKLNQYIENPQKLVPGNHMSFPGFSNLEDRKKLILYLSQAS